MKNTRYCNCRSIIKSLLLLFTCLFFLGTAVGVSSADELNGICINEIMASNGETISDEHGDSGDWIELYNPTDKPVDIGGFYFSDKESEPFKWQIPTNFQEKTTIPAGGFLLLWADEDLKKGPLHLNFKLSKDGEFLVITLPDRETVIEKLDFGKQNRDVSYGRKPDGSDQWKYFLNPTPEAPNITRGFSFLTSASYYLFYLNNNLLVNSVIILFAVVLALVFVILKIHGRLKDDLQEKRRARQQLEEITGEYETILNNTQDAIFLIDVSPDEEFRYKQVNQSYIDYTGLSLREVIARTPPEVYGEDPGRRIEGNYRRCFERNETISYDEELEFPRGKGVYHTQLSPVSKENRVIQIVGSSRDITERKRMEEEIRHLSYHDKLTGLYNRAYFNEELERYDTERQLPLSIIVADVNALKMTNDVFGHHLGDKLLVSIARIIKESCRQEDLVARWGGDEFVIILPQSGEKSAQKICQRIKRSCSGDLEIPVEPSIALGYAVKQETGEDIKQTFKKAEDRMYKNKLEESRKYRSRVISRMQETLAENTYETEEHSRRLKVQAVDLGRALQLAEPRIEDLKQLAELHDLGEVTVSAEILMKQEELSPEEWEEIKIHPEKGYHIAAFSTKLGNSAEGVLCHHEHWDGSGYPRGLKGKEIPLISRIFAVVDAYEALTSGRPYQPAVSKEEALQELSAKAGLQFDPEVVELFINRIKAE